MFNRANNAYFGKFQIVYILSHQKIDDILLFKLGMLFDGMIFSIVSK